jgi:hypothetical protein
MEKIFILYSPIRRPYNALQTQHELAEENGKIGSLLEKAVMGMGHNPQKLFNGVYETKWREEQDAHDLYTKLRPFVHPDDILLVVPVRDVAGAQPVPLPLTAAAG